MSLKSFKILLVTCMTFTKPALAEEVDQCPFVLGESVEAVSRARLQEFANNFPIKKSQFEPTAKFKARQESSVKTPFYPSQFCRQKYEGIYCIIMQTRNIFLH